MNSKNKIVVTTRDNIVAEAMGAHHTHHMKFLSHENSWKLFCFHANFPNHPLQEDQKLTSIARDIVQKCSGLPLAIKPIAASMARLRRVPNEWQSTLDRLNGMDRVNEADAINDRVMPSLRLSYQALPCLLKPRFVYCSAFPPNTQIKSEYLVHVWIVEEFVSSTSSSTQEAGDAIDQ
jgi:disease resistance protein RPM1